MPNVDFTSAGFGFAAAFLWMSILIQVFGLKFGEQTSSGWIITILLILLTIIIWFNTSDGR